MMDMSNKNGSNGAHEQAPVVIKKYANRRLYNTGSSMYVTLEDLGEMVKSGEEFIVTDAKSGEDITRSVLTQIIFELESHGQNLLPISFLRQLIRFYGDSLQALVPGFLDLSLQNFAQDHERWRTNITKAFDAPFEVYEEQVRKNMQMFERAFEMFSPFTAEKTQSPDELKNKDEMENMRRQMAQMQKQLDQLSQQKS